MESPADLKFCHACGTPVTPGGRFCSRCGMELGSTAAPPKPAKLPWYYNVWFVLFMLFCIAGPFGLPLVWKNPNFSRGAKIALTVIMILYTGWLIELTIRGVRAAMNHLDQLNSLM